MEYLRNIGHSSDGNQMVTLLGCCIEASLDNWVLLWCHEVCHHLHHCQLPIHMSMGGASIGRLQLYRQQLSLAEGGSSHSSQK